MNEIQKHLLERIADLYGTPKGAYNIRSNSKNAGRASTVNVKITAKPDKDGIDVRVYPGTKGELVYIPVIISRTGLQEVIYNDYYIDDGADVIIVGGCGIHADGEVRTVHDSVHGFHVGRKAKVKYIEKHYGEGNGKGERVMNPTTIVEMQEGSFMEMETFQIKGIDSTERITKAKLADSATFIVKERVMTYGQQYAKSCFEVELNGENSKTDVISRSVARGISEQLFLAKLFGKNCCYGHSECDSIIMDNAKISSIPEITAECLEAKLIHEAAIGKIAGEQLIKLMTLGLTAKEAETQIIQGFLK